MQKEMKTIREAATALCDRWDTPLWKDAKHTSVLVHELRTALAQLEQEPVAWMCNAFDGKVCEQSNHDECENPIPLYTTPPQRPWVELTDDDIDTIFWGASKTDLLRVREIEAKLKEKNT